MGEEHHAPLLFLALPLPLWEIREREQNSFFLFNSNSPWWLSPLGGSPALPLSRATFCGFLGGPWARADYSFLTWEMPSLDNLLQPILVGSFLLRPLSPPWHVPPFSFSVPPEPEPWASGLPHSLTCGSAHGGFSRREEGKRQPTLPPSTSRLWAQGTPSVPLTSVPGVGMALYCHQSSSLASTRRGTFREIPGIPWLVFPVFRTWHSHGWGLGSVPDWGTEILQASQHGHEGKKKMKEKFFKRHHMVFHIRNSYQQHAGRQRTCTCTQDSCAPTRERKHEHGQRLE